MAKLAVSLNFSTFKCFMSLNVCFLILQVALIFVSVVALTMANSQYQHGEYKGHGYQPTVSYGNQKKEYNHQPSYGGGHSSYQQPASYEHKGYSSHGYQAKPYDNEKKEYNHQHYQPTVYDKGQSYHHKPSSYEHTGSYGYEQPKSYGHHYPTY